MQKRIGQLHRFVCMVMLVLCAMLLFSSSACAIGMIDETHNTSLSVVARYDGKPLKGMTFRLYRVADMHAYGSFTLTQGFRDSDISPNGILPDDMTSNEWDDLAQTLAGPAEKMSPLLSAQADKNGMLSFADPRMGVGLYLLIGKPHTIDDVIYDTKPTLISLPGRNLQEQWVYHQVVYPKPEKPQKLYVDIEVVKVWSDCSYIGRPKCVTVDLLNNGCVIETVVLSAQNNWKHCWKNKRFDCKVVERPVGDSYTVRVKRSGNRFVITNSRPGPKPTRPSTLPQTGLLWWPVPLMAGAGAVLFVIGWIRRRYDEEE